MLTALGLQMKPAGVFRECRKLFREKDDLGFSVQGIQGFVSGKYRASKCFSRILHARLMYKPRHRDSQGGFGALQSTPVVLGRRTEHTPTVSILCPNSLYSLDLRPKAVKLLFAFQCILPDARGFVACPGWSPNCRTSGHVWTLLDEVCSHQLMVELPETLQLV